MQNEPLDFLLLQPQSERSSALHAFFDRRLWHAIVGAEDGAVDGTAVRTSGMMLGLLLGEALGLALGDADGLVDGDVEGLEDGPRLGAWLGATDGPWLGAAEGPWLGV